MTKLGSMIAGVVDRRSTAGSEAAAGAMCPGAEHSAVQTIRQAHGRWLRLALALLVILGAWPGVAPAAGVQAWLSATATTLDRPVELVVETPGPPSGAFDLSVLEADFRILDRRTTSSVTRIDGQRREQHRLTLRLVPRRTGELAVPPIAVGDERTPTLRLTVAEPAPRPLPEGPAAPHLSEPLAQPAVPAPEEVSVAVEAEVAPAEVLVGQQVLLEVRVLSRGPLTDPRLVDPQPQTARILPLGEDRFHDERDGLGYIVYERRYALFPEQPGRLAIAPVAFEAQVLGAAGQGRARRAESSALTLTVRPRPPGVPASAWLPARALALTEAGLPAGPASPGQPLARVVTLRAEGVLAADLPELALEAPFELEPRRTPPQLWDERTPSGVIGHRVERLTLAAREPGHYRLPEVRVPWWDTAGAVARVAILPARTLAIQPSGVASPVSSEPEAQEAPTRAVVAPDGLLPWVGLLLALALLPVLIRGWWRRARMPEAVATEPLPASPEDPALAAVALVRRAYAAGDALAAREALLAWSRVRWPADPPGNLARLVLRCPQPLQGQIALLEKSFFSPTPLRWEREPVWEGLAALHHAAP